MQTGNSPRLFSVGHSTHELAAFLDLLQGAGITAIADVRSAPYSRRLPQFNKGGLEQALHQAGIAYVFLGHQLGGRPDDDDLYDADGRVDYEKVRATTAFREGLDRLLRGAERYAVAMMCGEADPLDCHRGLMITPALVELGVSPEHLRRDGSIETTAEMEARLREETGVGEGLFDGLFGSVLSDAQRREIMADAYRKMASKKAYRRDGPPADE